MTEPIGYTGGHKFTRKEWEKSHKPTCNVYPCQAWKEIHWHFSATFFDDINHPPKVKLN